MHDTIEAQQITAPILDKYIRYSEASKMAWYHSIHNIIHDQHDVHVVARCSCREKTNMKKHERMNEFTE